MGLTNYIACLLLVFQSFSLLSQRGPFQYSIVFSDKSNSGYSIDRPDEFLSERSIERRKNQNIPIEESDLPISPTYIDSILKVNSITYLTKSRWFNQLIVSVKDTSVLAKVRRYSFIQSIDKLPGNTEKSGKLVNKELEVEEGEALSIKKLEYGNGSNQIEMLNGKFLHENGFMGQGVLIGVIDAGYTKANELKAFDKLWNEKRVIGYYDFVDNDNTVFEKSNHGTYVLSTMAAYLPGELIGTAPEASYLLLRSEDAGAEYLAEEYFWVAAAEYADSMGADVLNTSLGYTTFDDNEQDHTYADLDGNTTFITRGADKAASKGILVINSAGNSGNGDWFYIGAPADGDSVLAIGAVNPESEYASFSSKGPSFDQRVKPNVAAQGSNAVIASFEGGTRTGNGTSFSSPILTGMAACLWQAFPSFGNMDILHTIEASANQFNNPDAFIGYGIPDFTLAYFRLFEKRTQDRITDDLIKVVPNPFRDRLYLYLYAATNQQVEIQIHDMMGRTVYEGEQTFTSGEENLINIQDVSTLSAGMYLLQVKMNEKTWTDKLIKQ